MTISLVVAMAANRVIGHAGGMPWRLPEDLKLFKAVTMGKPMIMGRKTYESIGRPLPGRANIVVTRTGEVNGEGITVTHDFHEAVKLARAIAAGNETDEIMVIGGGNIYEQALPLADRIYLTEIHADFDGDTFFPVLGDQWREMSRTPGTPPEGGPAYDFVVLERGVKPTQIRHPRVRGDDDEVVEMSIE